MNQPKKVDRRVLRTKRAIEDAFFELLEKEKIDNISVLQIVQYADIGRKTFYLHYLDKYDFIEQLVEKKLAQLEKQTNEDIVYEAENSALSWFTFIDEQYLFFSRLLESKESNAFKHKFFSFTKEQLSKRIPPTKEEKEMNILLYFLSYAVTGIFSEYIRNDYREHKLEITKQINALVNKNLEN